MQKIKLIGVGKIKTAYWQDAEKKYLDRLIRMYPIEIIIVKDASPKLPPAMQRAKEAEAVLSKLAPNDQLICLDEHGSQMTSHKFAHFLQNQFEISGKTPCFLIGGAYGISENLLEKAAFTIRLSDMTFPHELARVVLAEQLFRAGTILKNMDYHH